jgi:hypothetical protein
MAMEKKQEGQWVVPNPQVPRSFGLMNIIFGALLILYAIVTALLVYIGPMLTRPIQESVQKQLADQRARQQAKIASLKDKLKSAKNDDEKKDIEAELGAIEADPVPNPAIFDDMMSGFKITADWRVAIYTWAEIVTGILLNVLMVVAGVALLALSEWGRKVSIAVAWLKIGRWLSIVLFQLVLIIPVTTQMMQKSFARMDAIASVKSTGAAQFPMRGWAQFSAAIGAVTVVGGALIASVYPAVSLWFLTRPRARAACLAAASPPGAHWPPPGEEPAQP